MSSELVQFGFEGNNVRIEVGDDGELMFVAVDVCNILEISDTSQAVGRLDQDEKGTCKVRTLGGVQDLLGLTESGLYTLVIRSNKPQAKPFRRWVTHEVLPQIRKTGRYETPTRKHLSIQESIAAIKEAHWFMEESGLSDAYTRVLVRESMQNHIRTLGNPYGIPTPAAQQPSAINDFFQIEELRGEFAITDKKWMQNRGSFGKAARAAIQKADPECEPLKVKKFVAGAEREVNAWPIGYRDIAIAAIQQFIDKAIA